jgi:tetratricopeptide (TPR) repeat protein
MSDRGDLGDDALERYADAGDPADLDLAVAHFEAALTAEPGHDSALWWKHRLGLACAERAGHRRDVADHDRAIDLLTEVAGALGPDPERDENLALLVDAWWERGLTLARSGGPVAEAERTAAAVGSLVPEFLDAELGSYARTVHGLALLAIYDQSEHRSDLEAGLAVLVPALDELPPALPRYVEASAWLCLAYRQLGSEHLDRSIAAGDRAAETAAPDDPDLPLLLDVLAQSYQDRWDVTEDDPRDLDRAIECWSGSIADGPEGHALTQCGRLLRERSLLGRDVADAREAIRLLELAVREPADDETTANRWYQLAKACQAGWEISRLPGTLERASLCLEEALARHRTADDHLLWLHLDQLNVWSARVREESERSPTEPPPSAGELRRQVTATRSAREAVGDRAEPDLRAMLATMLGLGELQGGITDAGSVDIDRVAALVAEGRSVRNPPAGWAAIVDGAEAGVQYILDNRKGGHRDGGLTPLLGALQRPGLDPDVETMLRQLMPVVLLGNAIRSGERRTLQAALDQARDPDSGDPDLALLARVIDLLDRAQHGEPVTAEVQHLAAELAADPPSYVAQQMVQPMLRMLQGAEDGRAGLRLEVDRTPLPAATGLEGLAVVGGALAAMTGPFTAAATRHDVPALRACALRFAELAGAAPAEPLLQLAIGCLAGLAELAVARDDPGDHPAAARAAEWFARTVEIAGGPQHPIWATVALGHGEALRRTTRPDPGRTRALGLSALRGFAWQVLLQSGTDDAVTVAAQASAAAMQVAQWCREDGAHDDLVAALDAGRGLVLQAATASRTIADRLTDAGREDLARRWHESAGLGHDAHTGGLLGALRATGPEIPDDLRLQVVRVLDIDDPVRPPEVRQALTAVGADALVYLVPATLEQPGAAVVVGVTGEVHTLVLPDLVTGTRSPVARFAATGVRDAGPVGAPAAAEGPSVDEVCRWAYAAAIGPLLRHAERWQLRRPARLILVPMGLLATVPWHGAFRQDGRDRHYAVDQAVFSYAVSGRTLCTSATFPDRPVGAALVVGDPGGDLPYAGLEARAIGDAFYPGCTYLGRPAGTGTPAQVLDWIAAAAPGPSLLHFACHGRVDPRSPANAHLALAGDTLTARHLLDASRTAELVMERVFLAACTTGMTGADHDEVFSLSTAFLAAGARTVFGSLWPVPDAETSVLMFMVHHYLNAESCAPADALHRAQRWMLDPWRRPPPSMPAELAVHCGHTELADPVAWAAFTHMGR